MSSMPPPEEMAAIFNRVYDEALALGLSVTEAHDPAHAAVLKELDARSAATVEATVEAEQGE